MKLTLTRTRKTGVCGTQNRPTIYRLCHPPVEEGYGGAIDGVAVRAVDVAKKTR